MRFQETFLVLLLLLQSCVYCADYRGTLEWNESVDSHNIKYIQNIFYLGQGYNIMKANPHSTQGLDPGYQNIQAVKLTYSDNLWRNVNPDRSYYVPDGTTLTVQKSCTMSFSAKEVTTLQEYTKNLEASVSLRGAYFGGKFRASVDYKDVESGMSSNEMQYIVSKATCAVFQMGIITSPNLHPLLSDEVLSDLKKLALFQNNTNNNEANAYYDFFDTWGTHVVTQLKLGSLFGYRFQMKKSDVKSMKKQGIDVSASASYFNVRGRANTQIEEDQKNQFTSAIQTWTSYSIGATPDENNDPAKWATQTLDKPMPIQSEITPYHDVIKMLTQRDKQGLSSSDIIKLASKLRLYSNRYCSERLLPNGRISSCKTTVTSDFNETQQDKMNSYWNIVLLDVQKTLYSTIIWTDSVANILFQSFDISSIPLKIKIQSHYDYYNGQFTNRYQAISNDSGDCIIASPDEGGLATFGDCNLGGDKTGFYYQAYDDNVFSLRLRSNPDLGIGIDETGYLKTMKVDGCFECQIFQIKQSLS